MRFRHVLVTVAMLMATVIALAQGRDEPKPSSAAIYRVTPWPNHSTDQRYGEEVELFLNQMASEGWRYHSELAAQGAKVMLFERVGK
ncbi:MAG: hypothetical protein AABZ47_06455 [Planctomycetota bacterium]